VERGRVYRFRVDSQLFQVYVSTVWHVALTATACNPTPSPQTKQIGVLLLSPADTPQRLRQRGSLLTTVDYGVAVHRTLVPAPLFLKYFHALALNGLFAATVSGGGCRT
jgi:hypothetical protein